MGGNKVTRAKIGRHAKPVLGTSVRRGRPLPRRRPKKSFVGRRAAGPIGTPKRETVSHPRASDARPDAVSRSWPSGVASRSAGKGLQALTQRLEDAADASNAKSIKLAAGFAVRSLGSATSTAEERRSVSVLSRYKTTGMGSGANAGLPAVV